MNVQTDNFAKKLLNHGKRSFTCNQCNDTGDWPGNFKKKNMFWFIMVLAHVVITLPQHPLPSRATRWFIPEKNLSVPNNVITPSHDLLISRHTCWKGEKLYSCSHCSLSCTTAGNLKDHVRTHSGEKPFHCDQCNYTSTLTHLKRHKLKHTGEKLFSCSQCSFSCSRDGNLKDHIRIHSGEEPFKH